VDSPAGQDFDADRPPARWGHHGKRSQALGTHGVAVDRGPVGASQLGIAQSRTKGFEGQSRRKSCLRYRNRHLRSDRG
jgi:hypothetical protein